MTNTRSRFCHCCQKTTRHDGAKSIGFAVGAVLTLLTAGLFLIVWIPVSFLDDLSGYRCAFCGSKNGPFKSRTQKTPFAVRVLCAAVLVFAYIIFASWRT